MPPRYAWFDVDHAAGSQLAVAYCLAQGRRQIAWLGSDDNSTRVCGYLEALGTLPPYALAAVPASRRAGYQQTCAWLVQQKTPDAIITDCGLLAEGAAVTFQQVGRAAGNHAIALIGWDGLPCNAILDHPLITVCQAGQYQVGEQLAEMVLQLLKGTPAEHVQTLWQPWLRLPA